MKGHTCNTKRSQKTFEPRTNKPNHSQKSRTTRTKYEPAKTRPIVTRAQMSTFRTQTSQTSLWGVQRIIMLIYFVLHNHTDRKRGA
jgi:hypothetical protein